MPNSADSSIVRAMARIDELPVPDWGLKCPHCGHAIAGLPEHRCGACGELFNIISGTTAAQ